MANDFIISDTHFGHENACTKFKRDDGSPLRPFASAEEMDEAMVERWNAVVRPFDKVYHLGDVVINKKFLPILDRLNGKKRLIRGNHDIFNGVYGKYFSEIYGVRVFSDMILSHIPLHPDSITRRFGTNVHGHLHANEVMITSRLPGDYGPSSHPDPRYLCVCVEHTDYTPISVEDVRKRIADRREKYDYIPPNTPWGNGPG
jgi:calcineurin-like phosphoesterase family protein